VALRGQLYKNTIPPQFPTPTAHFSATLSFPCSSPDETPQPFDAFIAKLLFYKNVADKQRVKWVLLASEQSSVVSFYTQAKGDLELLSLL
jgi:hypothetical protein